MSRIFTAIEWLLITITKSPMRMQAGAHSPFVTKAIDHCLALTELAAAAFAATSSAQSFEMTDS